MNQNQERKTGKIISLAGWRRAKKPMIRTVGKVSKGRAQANGKEQPAWRANKFFAVLQFVLFLLIFAYLLQLCSH